MQWEQLTDRIVPLAGFLLCITVVAELADRIGVFRVLADRVAVLGRGSVVRLWGAVVVLAVVSTTVLSLDSTAVLLTPVVLALASQLGLDRTLFAYTTVWLANTASLTLPVSNLTNLLALQALRVDTPDFVRLMWPAAAASIVITVVVLAVLFRRSLTGQYARPVASVVRDRPLLVLAMVVCAVMGAAFAVGASVTTASGVAALILVLACLVRAPDLLSWRLLPLKLIIGVGVLFVIMQVAEDQGLSRLLSEAVGAAETSWVSLVRLAAVAALGANVVDNLPSYLAMEPVASGSPVRMAAVLVGVNAGPLITPWASVATLLWAARCRTAGVPVRWRGFALRGLLIVPLLLTGSVAALVLSGR